MLLATWNVNSIRSRLERLLAFLDRHTPDVVCLQEIKVADLDFPHEAIREAGYHAAVHGQRTYNGVAILARVAPEDVVAGLEGADPDDDQARLITATVAGVRVASAYIPNGKLVGSDKWEYKLRWLDRLRQQVELELAEGAPFVLAGDFNVAPGDPDVALPDEWATSVLCHAEAREALERITRLGLADTIRSHHQGPGPYTWWDYRMLAFPKGNGLRIDHIFADWALAGRCTSAWVDRAERKGKLPSDHAPVLAEFSE